MGIRVGIDVVSTKRFTASAQRGGHAFLARIFTAQERVTTQDMRSLAGLFAAKEAAIKALSLPVGAWQEIAILKDKSGRPQLKLKNPPPRLASADVSISHDGEVVVAVVSALYADPD